MPLKDELKDALDWSQYEAAAYAALVKDGPMEASDIALRADIPDSRIYSILSGLEEKGCVLKQGRRPAEYDAQHPRYVIQDEQERFIDESDEVEAKLANAWETERDDNVDHTDDSWVLASASGTVSEIRRLIDDATSSVRIVDTDLRWISRRKDVDTLQELAADGVDIQIIGASETALDNVKDLEEADLRYHGDLDKAYYIIDEKHVIMRIHSGRTGIVFSEEQTARIFGTDFESTLDRTTKVDTNAS
ncbi:TrmB family transcriptional regulator [Halosimplex salinum]|uniref:TrmB family transcriptional regulator n=1 Tax=Halosimplex salinum TaxID=1710538 RepID=UPI000F4754F9|nr:helix-turn-helix domain-containing protein [Halosimplex salinum]